MKVFEGFDDLPVFGRAVVTVGSFDGVHRGHCALLDRVVGSGGQSVVVTFSPHPREVLGSGVKLLTTLPEKIALLERAGVENLIVAPFTPEFSRLSGDDFVRLYLVGKVGMKKLVSGYNHHLGHDHATGPAAHGDFEVEVVDKHGEVSSTVVRRLVEQGRMADAAELLGYRYFIMHPDPRKLLPPAGTYPTDRGPLTVGADGTLALPGHAPVRDVTFI